ncbi:hypothetical protein [Pararhodobacter sp. CCB-MM2]|uniref:hypothetical protein n=1 Tax=Pararhodobacter sp. CCB-MM2 TaxID=1786003 RepID=UPI0008323C6B|nr:hypothetical protein [Pararhodobacter sp. CCB-MM2]MCA2013006.1 hypothetical protein [Cereibacter sphaeroides]
MEGMMSAMGVAVLGLGLLAGKQLLPVGDGPVAAVLPPWRDDGAARIAALNLPILDIRWGGRLVVVDAGPGGASQVWHAGLLPLAAVAPATCLTTPDSGDLNG